MDFQENILTRRSIRKYTDKKLPQDLKEKIFQAAMQAPSAKNYQPWEFIAIEDKKMLQTISRVSPHGKMLEHAALGVIVCCDVNRAVNFEYGVIDTAAATQNLLLSAHGHGLGAVWIGVYPREERVERLKEIFSLPKNIVPISMVAIGYPSEEKKRAKRFDEKKLHKERWQ